MKDKMQFEELTRKIFHQLHKSQASDEKIFNRLTSLLTTEYLQVDKEFFKNKLCLDAGCGSNANATYSMLKMGARKVVAFDLNETVLELTPKILNEFDPSSYDIKIGNVLQIDFPDDYFDFVHCGGVLHHTADPRKGFGELARVTKPGRMLYIHIYGSGGLIRDLTSFFREKYQKDASFKEFISTLSAQKLRNWLEELLMQMEKHGDPLAQPISKLNISQLVDDDLVLTIQDRIMAPVYYEYTEEQVVSWYREEGFEEIERLTRYPGFSNIRRFLSPLYENYSSELAKLLFGSGYLQFKGIK